MGFDLSPSLPSAFCWTKIGVESGERLSSILLRKEWEREAGAGLFFWGIGNALGTSVRALASRSEHPEVLFSEIRSKPRSVDSSPTGVLVWQSFIDQNGDEIALPQDVWVTSRDPGSRRTPHYALVCRSAAPLTRSNDYGSLVFEALRNVGTGRKLGHSQVTAVVERDSTHQAHGVGREYKVVLRCSLVSPHYVRLASPLPLSKDILNAQAKAIALGDQSSWLNWVRQTRSDMRDQSPPSGDRAASQLTLPY